MSFKPILENGFFSNVSEVIIQNCVNYLNNQRSNSKNQNNPDKSQKFYLDDKSNAVLGRIATITFNSFYNCPKESMESINFLPDLLYFCYNPSVCSLFEKLLTGNTRFLGIQNWLVNDAHIGSKIVEVIKFFKSNDTYITNDEDDDYTLNIASMYKLLSYGLVSPNIGKYFRSDLCVSIITETMNSNDKQRIKDAQWHSAVCLINSDISLKILPLVEIAVKNLIKPTDRLTREIVQCISFLTLMLKYLPFQTAKVLSDPSYQIFSVIMRIAIQFSSSSALHFSFRSFVINCVKNRLLMPEVIHAYIPFFIAEIRNRNHYLNQLEIQENWKSSPIKSSVEFVNYEELKKNKNSQINSTDNKNSNSNSENILLSGADDYSSHPKFKESSQNGLFYATCWDLLIKIDNISLYSTSLSKKSVKISKSPSITSNIISSLPKKKSLFSNLSSKFQKNYDQKCNDDNSNTNNISVTNDNNASTNIFDNITADSISCKPCDIQNELSKISDFDLFVRDELKSYVKLIESSYGGPLPIIPTDQQQPSLYSKL